MTVTPDNSGRVATIRAVRGSTVLSDLSYTYSRLVGSTATDGVLTRSRVNNQATGTAGKTTTYGYDSLARLTSAVEKDTTGMTTTASWAYGYDPAGNRTSATLSPTGAVGTGDGVLSGGGQCLLQGLGLPASLAIGQRAVQLVANTANRYL